ncbi:MAG: (2Fe-2S)-binding protein [Candidatus Obscuribacterales bacterium]|nr:(2Fe-2S)-binding protein [Candidatus Obscuribacterales bacterium]
MAGKDDEYERKQSRDISRRRFLKGAGLTALSMANLSEAQAAKEASAAIRGPGATAVTLRVNNAVHNLQVEPCETLAETLRTQLGMTGTKVSCDRGTCSACTVWLDGATMCACMTLTVDVQDRAVTTIEGLAQDGKLHPVQEAFIEKDATMCGFCTPGMVMSCAALLARNSSPTLDDVREATCGNFCRCGTYPKVFAATLAAAGKGVK